MTFWIIAALMTGLGIAVLAFVLLRTRPDITSNLREHNLLLAREKLAELEREKAAGNVEEETYAQAREELETGLLEDTAIEDTVVKVQPASARVAAIGVAILVPLLSVGIYMQLGSPQYLDMSGAPGAQSPHAMGAGGSVATMEELLQGLEERVQQVPEDPEGWFMLGRVYQSMDRFADAVTAYEKLAELTDDHPQALIALADSLAMAQGGKLSGRPYELVRQALDQEPEDPTALWLAGQGAMEAEDFQNAIYYWRQAEAGLADQPDYVQEIRTLIARAKEAAASAGIKLEDPGSSVPETASAAPTSEPPGEASEAEQRSVSAEDPGSSVPVSAATPAKTTSGITLSVSLDPSLQDMVSSGDRLFVFAKQVQGPPMPVAAVRIAAGELPAQLELGDSSMLQQGTKLADYQELKIAARIARGSEPMAASGDLQSKEILVQVGADRIVDLVIDQVVP